MTQVQVQVKATEIQTAMLRADAFSDEWQAYYLEIILLEQVKPVWVSANHGHVDITRYVAKRPFHKIDKAGALRISNRSGWLEYSGYSLQLSRDSTYNCPVATSYSHSAARTWDGVRRETVKSFIVALRDLFLHHNSPHVTMHDFLRDDCESCLERFGLQYVQNIGGLPND